MKTQAIATLALLLLGTSAQAQQGQAQQGMPPMVPIAAPTQPDALPLYGDKTPGSPASEIWARAGADTVVRNVTQPTLTPVLPDPAKATGAAAIVIPGGAFMLLSMDHEGWQVAHALAARGIAAFVLKYRLAPTPVDPAAAGPFMGAALMREIGHPMTGDLLRQSGGPADAAAAMALVRAHAAQWHVDPARVGVIGFSAGAMTARRVALDAPAASRPAFVGYIYGPQDSEAVGAEAPPLFDAIALDDPLFPWRGFALAQTWAEAKRPVEIHGYQKGSHGFGLGVPGTTTTMVLDEFIAWLSMQGILARKDIP